MSIGRIYRSDRAIDLAEPSLTPKQYFSGQWHNSFKIAFIVKIHKMLVKNVDEASLLSYGSHEQQLNHLSICSFYS